MTGHQLKLLRLSCIITQTRSNGGVWTIPLPRKMLAKKIGVSERCLQNWEELPGEIPEYKAAAAQAAIEGFRGGVV
jgi:hypothetical protein